MARRTTPAAGAGVLSSAERWLYGGLGALAPVVVSALTLDFTSIFSSPDFAVMASWVTRSMLLFVVGGFVAFMHKAETDHWKCFVTGISAPALITTALAGTAATPGPIATAALPSFLPVSSAMARIPEDRVASLGATIELHQLSTFGETSGQKVWRGFFGRNPYIAFVILSPQPDEASARRIATAVGVYGVCAAAGAVEPQLPKEVSSLLTGSFNSSAAEMMLFVLDSGAYVPVLLLQNPEVTSLYSVTLSEMVPVKGQILTQQSTMAGDLQKALQLVPDAAETADTIVPKVLERVSPDCSLPSDLD